MTLFLDDYYCYLNDYSHVPVLKNEVVYHTVNDKIITGEFDVVLIHFKRRPANRSKITHFIDKIVATNKPKIVAAYDKTWFSDPHVYNIEDGGLSMRNVLELFNTPDKLEEYKFMYKMFNKNNELAKHF